MMAMEEKTAEVPVTEHAISSESKKEELDADKSAQVETEVALKKEEPEVKMETDETQLGESCNVNAEVLETMEAKSAEPEPEPETKEKDLEEVEPTKKEEEADKKDEEANKKDDEEVKLSDREEVKLSDENDVKEGAVEETPKEHVEEKEVVVEDKEDKVDPVTPDSCEQVNEQVLCKEESTEMIEDWDVLGTDDEEGDIVRDKKRSGVWMPDNNIIIDLYQKLDKEGVLELQWKCPGRRQPEKEKTEKEEMEKMEEEIETKETEEKKEEEEPTEFDFDVDTPFDTPTITSMTPRRTPGSGHAQGSGKKRVARMDKIFNDMMRHKRIDEELQRVGDGTGSDEPNRTETTPQRAIGKFRIRKDF